MGGAAGDYDFTYVSGTLKVTKAAVQPDNQNNNQGNNQSGDQQQNKTNEGSKSSKKAKSGKKSIIPDMSDPATLSAALGFAAVAAGTIATGAVLRKRS